MFSCSWYQKRKAWVSLIDSCINCLIACQQFGCRFLWLKKPNSQFGLLSNSVWNCRQILPLNICSDAGIVSGTCPSLWPLTLMSLWGCSQVRSWAHTCLGEWSWRATWVACLSANSAWTTRSSSTSRAKVAAPRKARGKPGPEAQHTLTIIPTPHEEDKR